MSVVRYPQSGPCRMPHSRRCRRLRAAQRSSMCQSLAGLYCMPAKPLQESQVLDEYSQCETGLKMLHPLAALMFKVQAPG